MTIYEMNLYDGNAREKAENAKQKLDGKTYFNFSVDYGVIPGGLSLTIDTDCELDRITEALEMVIGVLIEG